MSAETSSTKLPPAHGATPRQDPDLPPTRGLGHSEPNFSASADAQDLKMIHWYKLANEAAMKAALVKHKRFKEVPRLSLNTIRKCGVPVFIDVFCRYNPAAERVRQRAKWMEQVIIEEQNKPLELDTAAFTRIMELVCSFLLCSTRIKN